MEGRMTEPLYDTDFYQWTQTQAAALRAKDIAALDLEHLAEEIESLGKRDRRAVESYLEIILLHLLKWAYQPQRRGRSWEKSLLQARHRVAKLLRDNPSLANQVPGFADEGYPHARRLAAVEMSLPLPTFPETCPWVGEQVLDEDFWPEMAGAGA
jgi:Domain of unknown function DUF29